MIKYGMKRDFGRILVKKGKGEIGGKCIMSKRPGCPNLIATKEGRGIISSGHWVCKCAAQGNMELRPDVVIRLCVHNNGWDLPQCCRYRNDTTWNVPEHPSYEGCKYCKGIYR